MKIDCSKTLNYAAERTRMCDSFSFNSAHKCGECPLYPIQASCILATELTEAHINAVQKWSDEHPQETMAEHFLKLFPNAPEKNNEPIHTCPYHLGWEDDCPKRTGKVTGCKECWNRPYIEVK